MNTVLNVKLDPELKKQAQETAKALGLPLSTVVAAGLRDFVRTRSVTISDVPRLKPEIEDQLLEIESDISQRDDLSPAFQGVDDAITWLESDD